MACPVFISYSRQTSAGPARDLAARLGPDTAYLDVSNIGEGDYFPRALAQAILDARVVVCFADDSYFERWYCLKELQIALTPYDAATRSGTASSVEIEQLLEHIVIALPSSGMAFIDNLPPRLRALQWPKADDSPALAKLVERKLASNVLKLRDKITAAAGSAIQETFLTETAMPPPTQLPRTRYPRQPATSLFERFVGRADDLFRIHFALSTMRGELGRGAALTGAVEAGGGFGKTRLAREYAWRFGATYYPGGVFWLDAEQDEDGLRGQFHGIIEAVFPETPALIEYRQAGRNARRELPSALEKAAAGGPILFIVDNLPEPKPGEAPLPLEHYCPGLGSVTVLMTTRSHLVDAGVRSLRIDVLERKASRSLLIGGAGLDDLLSSPEWDQICAWVGDLPLALEALNKVLDFREITPKELLIRSQRTQVTRELERQIESIRNLVPAGSLRGVAGALAISYEALSVKAKAAATCLAWLAPDPIPVDLLIRLGLGDVRGELVAHSVLTRDTQKIGGAEILGSMHRVMGDYLRARSNHRSRELRTVCRALEQLITPAGILDPAEWPVLRACLPHAEHALTLAYQEVSSQPWLRRWFAGKLAALSDRFQALDNLLPVQAAWLGMKVTELTRALGELPKAIAHGQAVFEFCDAAMLPPFLRWGVALPLASALREQGSPRQAEQLERGAIAAFTRCGPRWLDTLIRAKANLAVTLTESKDMAEAEVLAQEALEHNRRVYGLFHRETITCLHNLASIVNMNGQIARAREMFERAHEQYRQVLREDHPDTLRALGWFAETQDSLEKRCEIQERVWSLCLSGGLSDHVFGLGAAHNLGITYHSLKQYARAREIEEGTLERRKRVLGEEHEDTLRTAHNLGSAYRRLSEYAKAAEMEEWTLERRKRVLGEEHADTLQTAYNLGNTYRQLKEYVKARAIEEWTLERRKRVLGEEHADTLQTAYNLGNTYRQLKEYAKARAIEEWTLERRKRVLGEEHADTLLAAQNLSVTYWQLNQYAKEREIEEWTLERQKRVLGEEHADTLQTAHNLGVTYWRLSEYAKGRQLQEWTLERRKRVLGEEHADTLRTGHDLINTYWELGEDAKCFAIGKWAWAGRRKLLGEDHADAMLTAWELGWRLSEAGDRQEAADLLRLVIAYRGRSFGEHHSATNRARVRLGFALTDLGQFEEAEALLSKVRESMPKPGAADGATRGLARLAAARGQLLQAKELFQEACAARLASDGKEASATIRTAWDYVEFLDSTNDPDLKDILDVYLAWLVDRDPSKLGRDERYVREKMLIRATRRLAS